MDKEWELMGERMPYYGVGAAESLKPGALDQKAIDDFFASGEEHVANVLDWVRHYLHREFGSGRCLDFGCGVGRLVIPFTKHFSEVVGVDISPGMLAEAQRNCDVRGIENAKFVLSDDDLSKVEGKFDLIHSFIVLQHIAVKRGERLFDRMLSLLAEDGVGVLHFTYAKEGDTPKAKMIKAFRDHVPMANGVFNLLKGRDFSFPYAAMNDYHMNKILRTLQEHGFGRTVIALTNHGKALGAALIFQNKPDQEPKDFLT